MCHPTVPAINSCPLLAEWAKEPANSTLGKLHFKINTFSASIGKLPRFTLEERCGFPGLIRAWLWGVKNYSQILFCLNGEQRRLALIIKGPSEGGVQRKYSFDSNISNIDVGSTICHQNSFLQLQGIYTNKQASNSVTQKTQQNSPSASELCRLLDTSGALTSRPPSLSFNT